MGWVVGWVVVLVLGGCAVPHPPPAPPRQTNLDLTISQLELANGLRVVLVRDPRATDIQVTMRYLVGSADDPADQAGVAHFVEHLMFQQVLGAQSLFAHLEQSATSFNATTTWDATTYFERAQPAHLDELLSIEAIRLGFRCASLTDSAFAREREVVINELRQHDDTTEIRTAINVGLYPAGHPYRRPIGGSDASVASITRDQACSFADAHYGPKNAVLVVSGDLTSAQLESALGKFVAHIAKRTVVPPVPAPEVAMAARRVEVPVPIDDPAFLIAWPLPRDPQLRAQVRALVSVAAGAIDGAIKGQVTESEFGDERAPMLVLAVFPKAGAELDDDLASAKKVLDELPSTFGQVGVSELGELAFDRLQQTAIYRRFAMLEDGGGRDAELAGYVLAGRSPEAALAAAFKGLRELTPDEAAAISREQLSFERAAIVLLQPSDTKKRGHGVALDAAIHDLGQRRDPPDPALAHLPSTTPVDNRGLASMAVRELPNGLKIVLLPVTSVPTVDVRLVFRSGRADEPTGKHGAAFLAAHALTWDLHYLNDLLAFAAAGGTEQVDVANDHTSFIAHGVDMHLDFLLAGLRRWIREGEYEGDAVLVAMRAAAKQLDDEGALGDAWRAAVFGAGHPYATAGRAREASAHLTIDDAAQFRAAHYAPNNATLVIAGHFDAALANRWIDFLFADWKGTAESQISQRATSQPASLAKVQGTAQVELALTMPAIAGPPAAQLVAAEMLAAITGEVRHELGASYGLGARLDESRLAVNYVIAGWIDDARARDALELVRAGIDKLHGDPDAAARAFVSARERVLVRLGSMTGSAEQLATRVEHDVELARAPMSDVATAAAVQQLTIEGMAATLADLDLARAVILMRGPAAEIEQAYAVIGRKPTYIHVSDLDREDPLAEKPAAAEPPAKSQWDSLKPSDLVEAITSPAPASPLMLELSPGYSFGAFGKDGISGGTIAGEIGYRFDVAAAIGFHVSVGYLAGTHDVGMIGEIRPILTPLDVLPLNFSAVLHATVYDRLWGGVAAGVNFDQVTQTSAASGTQVTQTAWQASLSLALEGGVDIFRRDADRFGVYLRAESEVPSASYVALTLGLAYRQ